MVPVLLQRRTKSNYMLGLFLLLSWLLPVAFVTVRILSIHNGLPRGALLLCLIVKPKRFCPGPCPPVGGYGKEEINTSPPPRLGLSRRYLQELWVSSPPPPFCPIKESGIQIDTDKRVILRHQSAIFLVSWLSE